MGIDGLLLMDHTLVRLNGRSGKSRLRCRNLSSTETSVDAVPRGNQEHRIFDQIETFLDESDDTLNRGFSKVPR
jgi:hypothetical protein